MSLYELFIIAVALSMDAFAVAICKGLSIERLTVKEEATVGFYFGFFQALMPLCGFFLGSLFAGYIESVDHWVAFGLLALIGANMLKEAFEKKEECCGCKEADISPKAMFPMAVATSIDALAVGIGLAMTGGVNIWLAVVLIGAVTFLLSNVGVKIGSLFGARFEKKAQVFGGVMLILLGLKILLEHLGVL